MAIGDNNKIQIELELNSKGAITSAKSLNNEISNLEASGSKSVDSLTSSFASLKGAITGLGLGLAIRQIGEMASEGRKIQGLTNAFNELQASAGALGSQTLSDLRSATQGLVSDMELMQAANNAVLLGLPTKGFDELAKAATKLGLATGRDATEALNDLVTGVGRGSKLILDNLGIVINTRKAYEDFAASIHTTVDALTDQQKQMAFQQAAYDKIREKSAALSDITIQGGAAYEQFTIQLTNTRNAIVSFLNQSENVKIFFQLMGESINVVGDVLKEFIYDWVFFEGLVSTKSFEGANKHLDSYIKRQKQLGSTLKEVNIHLEKQTPLANKAATSLVSSVSTSSASSSTTSSSAKNPLSILETLLGRDTFATDALKGTKLEGLVNGLFGEDSSFANQSMQQLTQSLGGIFQGLASGGSLDASLGSLGQSIGQTLGRATGIPFIDSLIGVYGQKIGESISGIGKSTGSSVKGIATILTGGLSDLHGLGGIIEGAFGGNKNAEANARTSFEKFIREVLDEKKLQLVIDGQLQKLDFGITGGRGAFDGGAGFNVFEGMDADVVAGFSGIGTALQQVLGITEDLGSQFGAILADNVGNLNNLQILLNRTGVTAEQMGESVKDAWLTGDLTAVEALTTLQKIQQVTTQGIPDGLGFTTQAFNNLVQSAGSGELVLDALGDLAVEAKEKGVGSLEALRQELLASGQDASKVNSAFDAIAQAGITSLEALKNVSTDTALQISATLEQTPDFFAEKVARLDEIQQKLNNLENKEVDIQFNFKSSVDRNTQEMREAGAFNSAGIESVGAEGVL